jgi:YbgC/YbaW family acyl-CoA thioester hydrolase
MPHSTEFPVTWGDTDAGGLIYYPRFFHFVVTGLNDYFAPAVEAGHLMESLRRAGYVLPAVEASASFESPLRAGDLARIETTVEQLGDASLTVAFEVFRAATDDDTEGDDRAAVGEVTFVLVDGAFEATSLPAAVRACVETRGDVPAN